jgi:hypothetical protein
MGRFVVFAGVLIAVALSSCARSHFETVVEISASKHPRTCDGRFTVHALNSYAYRVDACEGALYYRCFYQRKTMGRGQCCEQVEDEDTATATFGSIGADTTCVSFVD